MKIIQKQTLSHLAYILGFGTLVFQQVTSVPQWKFDNPPKSPKVIENTASKWKQKEITEKHAT